ncbi:unnamed protein product [Urochloa decumbens]|uniref:Uncharacterized protein n=1 Tax=Urochloa decumbens TaxID=240449 RepID=A0ABC9C1Q2_9POAL
MASEEGLKFLLPWFAFMYYMTPALSFLVTKNWKKVFNDCFGPEVLVSDTVTTIITLWYHIFGVKDAENPASIILHSLGLGLNIMSICMYAMYHSMSGGMEKAIYWYRGVLVAFPVVAFLTFLWVQLGVTINSENDWMATMGYTFAICAEIFEILWPAALRIWKKEIVNDEKMVFWLKVGSTTLSVVISSSDLWRLSTEDVLSKPIEKRFKVLSIINIIGGVMQLVIRLIGPEKFADPVKGSINLCCAFCAQRCTQLRNKFHNWID